jgi:hypothetical protein
VPPWNSEIRRDASKEEYYDIKIPKEHLVKWSA